jgi:hypothetical protein
MYTNFVIDYAKTLYVPEFPDFAKKEIHKYTKNKLPHFFIYAKDKEKKQVEGINDSVVNRLEKIIPNKPIQFKRIAGDLKYEMLMNRGNVNLNKDIIKKYNELHKNKKWKFNLQENVKSDYELYVYKQIRNEMLTINPDPVYIVDVLVKYLYGEKVSKNKETLWKTFGDILLINLKENLKNTKQCQCCGKRIDIINSRTTYCSECWKERQRELWRINKQIKRKMSKFENVSNR